MIVGLAAAALISAAAPAHAVSPLSTRSTEVGGCTAAATKTLVHQLVGDFNTGRLARVERLFAPAPRFQWYSTPSRSGDESKNRSTLIPYLRSRVREHERILLITLGAGYNPRQDTVDFGGTLVRSADDIRPKLVRGPNGLRPIRHPFKGAADCVSGHPRLIVWSM